MSPDGTTQAGGFAPGPANGAANWWLACRIGRHLCALPSASVVETMRPLPLQAMARAPRFVAGVSIVRGAPVPVVDAAALFGESATDARRLVIVRVAGRTIALRVDSVLGLRDMPGETLSELPPLLRQANADIVSAIGLLDAELLLFLRAARLVPEETADSEGGQAK